MRIVWFLFLTVVINTLPILNADIAMAEKPPAATTAPTIETATEVLKGIDGEILAVSPSEVPGLYRVAMKMQGKVIPLYLDATGSYLLTGNIIRLKDRKNLTEEYFRQLNPADLSKIPLAEALTLGNPEATQQVVVFTDPHCPFCSKLHQVMQEAVKANPELAFQIKLLPLKQSSRQIAQTILCNKSMEQLEMAFSGQALPEPDCVTDEIAENLKLAQDLGINGTPTLILPNGQIAPGYHPLVELLELIKNNSALAR